MAQGMTNTIPILPNTHQTTQNNCIYNNLSTLHLYRYSCYIIKLINQPYRVVIQYSWKRLGIERVWPQCTSFVTSRPSKSRKRDKYILQRVWRLSPSVGSRVCRTSTVQPDTWLVAETASIHFECYRSDHGVTGYLYITGVKFPEVSSSVTIFDYAPTKWPEILDRSHPLLRNHVLNSRKRVFVH